MKKKVFFSALFISLNLVAAYGQETKDKKSKVIEKTPAVIKVASVPAWNPDMEVFKYGDSLPKNYGGVSAEPMVKWVLKKSPREKGEFEKQADYEQKVSDTEELLKEKLYAFNIKEAITYEKYDADREAFIPRSYSSISFMGSDQKEFTLARNSKDLGSYVASNAYGKSVTVKKFDDDEYGIYLSKSDLMKTGFFKEGAYSIEFNSILPVPIEKAKTIKAADISMLAVGYIGARNIKHTVVCLSPKIDSPFDGCMVGDYLPLTLKKVYVYHKPTGEVFAIKDIE